MPVVTTAMLPTVVPAGTENLSIWAALTEPMATLPKFWLAGLPVKLTCALAATGCANAVRRKSEKEMRAAIGRNSWLSTNPVARLGRCIEAKDCSFGSRRAEITYLYVCEANPPVP